MSLSSILLGGSSKKKDTGKSIDTGLDELFKSNPVATASSEINAVVKSDEVKAKNDKKRKLAGQEEVQKEAKKVKKAKKDVSPVSAPSPKKAEPPSKTKKATKADKAGKAIIKPAPSASGSNEEEVAREPVPSTSSSDPDSDEEGDPSKLVHESVANGGKPKPTHGKTKYVPAEETPEQRDARTIFIGNVPVEAVKSRPLQKQFNRHILSFVPEAKIESVRFRSVAFNKPTTDLSSTDPTSSTKAKDGRKHDRERAATWRATQGEDEPGAETVKKFLTPQEKKRVAFIKQEIHTGVDSVNAYVVFAHAPPTENRPKNLPPPKPVMDPYEAAKAAVREADGSVFEGRTIRVDLAMRGGKKGEVAGGASEMAGDPKATLFVGSLDFACKEEDVRAFFEGLVVAERGAPGERADGDSSSDEPEDEDSPKEKAAAKPRTWVKRVRIIRDKDTLLGKGFGYVQFVDRECVDEILAMDESRLKFAKRKLRVQRCKTLPGGPKVPKKFAAVRANAAANANPTQPRARAPRAKSSDAPAPKGDPNLGSKIAGLTKEERKKIKATNADRVARRLAKKQAKALAEKGVKAKGSDKERVRKRPKDKKGGAAAAGSKSKKRVRSGNALAKMNTKK